MGLIKSLQISGIDGFQAFPCAPRPLFGGYAIGGEKAHESARSFGRRAIAGDQLADHHGAFLLYIFGGDQQAIGNIAQHGQKGLCPRKITAGQGQMIGGRLQSGAGIAIGPRLQTHALQFGKKALIRVPARFLKGQMFQKMGNSP